MFGVFTQQVAEKLSAIVQTYRLYSHREPGCIALDGSSCALGVHVLSVCRSWLQARKTLDRGKRRVWERANTWWCSSHGNTNLRLKRVADEDCVVCSSFHWERLAAECGSQKLRALLCEWLQQLSWSGRYLISLDEQEVRHFLDCEILYFPFEDWSQIGFST